MCESCNIPPDWALHTTNMASEWVEQQFVAHISGQPLVVPPPEHAHCAVLSTISLVFGRCILKSG
jgi:hypothetical protein